MYYFGKSEKYMDLSRIYLAVLSLAGSYHQLYRLQPNNDDKWETIEYCKIYDHCVTVKSCENILWNCCCMLPQNGFGQLCTTLLVA